MIYNVTFQRQTLHAFEVLRMSVPTSSTFRVAEGRSFVNEEFFSSPEKWDFHTCALWQRASASQFILVIINKISRFLAPLPCPERGLLPLDWVPLLETKCHCRGTQLGKGSMRRPPVPLECVLSGTYIKR